jgi:hypothetical protein
LASNFCVTLNFSSAHYQQDKSQIKNLKSLELFCQMTFATVSVNSKVKIAPSTLGIQGNNVYPGCKFLSYDAKNRMLFIVGYRSFFFQFKGTMAP